MGYHQDFKDKRALVTGGSRGIGRAIAESLLSFGADVTVVGRNPEHLATLQKSHPSIKTICADLGDWEKTVDVLSTSGQTFDILVNNAGVCTPESFLTCTSSNFTATFATNVGSLFSVSQVVAKAMIASKVGGSIVNISSLCSKSPFPGISIYSASKAGVDMVTKCMAVELGGHGIRVNSVNCAGVDTDMMRANTAYYQDNWKEEDHKAFAGRIPLKGISGGEGYVGMEQVVEATLFLLSSRASGATTGQQFWVDNGYSIG